MPQYGKRIEYLIHNNIIHTNCPVEQYSHSQYSS